MKASATASNGTTLPPARPIGRLGQFTPKDLKRRLARLNHVLIPDKKLERDRLRQRRWVKLLGAGFAVSRSLTREGRVLLALMLPVGLASLDVRYSQVYLFWAMLLGLLLSAWAVRPLFKAKALSAGVQNAKRVSVNQEMHFEVQLNNHGTLPLWNLRVLCPFLPWDGRWTHEPRGLPELLPGQHTSVTARARFVARGEHHLDTFNVGRLVPGGLAVGPTTASPGARFLVVPRIANVTDVVLAGAAAEGAGSMASSVQPGETDIAGVRPYRVGDELRHLHARTWARTGVPHVRHYLDERQDSVTLAVLTTGPDVSERVKEATLSLAAGAAARLATHQHGIDTLVCDDEVFRVTPRTGDRALEQVLDQLAVLELSAGRTSLAALRHALQQASQALLIATEDSEELRTLVERTRARGVRCSASVVVEPTWTGQRSVLRPVRADAIERGRAIRL